jgi:hypothetical protein
VADVQTDGTSFFISPVGNSQVLKFGLTTAFGTTTTNNTLTSLGPIATVSNISSSTSVWNTLNGMVVYQTGVNSPWVAVSNNESSSITYPNNLAAELISYQSAIDFLAKQKADTSAVSTRFESLFQRYKDSLHRDDYQVERIKNDYPQTNYNYFR